MRKPLSICITATLGAIYASAPADAGFSGMVIFGDSLSDVGNVYDQTFGIAPQSPPYFNGRYSNGPLWDERLAQSLNVPAPTPSRMGGRDYAYAGTKTGGGSTFIFPFFFPNIGSQINSFLGSNTPNASDLFVVWGGGNDFIDGQSNPAVPANNIAAHVTALANAGARQFLVPNLPPLGQVPRYKGTANEATMDARSAQFNDLLATRLDDLETSLNIQIWQLDVEGLFHDMLSDPSSYGFTNISNPALVGNTPSPNQDEYLFWDDIHPTRVGHQILGAYATGLVVTHKWVSTQTGGSWTAPGNWDPAGVPQPDWITHVINDNIALPQAVAVDQNSTVNQVLVRGDTAPMTLIIQSTSTLTANQVEVQQQGKIDLHGAILSTPSLSVSAGGAISGSGLITGNVTSAGIVAPGQPGTILRVGGNFQQQPGGRTEIELAGRTGEFDRLQIDGSATLAGTLAVQLLDGFVALPGDSFQVLTFSSRSGEFSIVNETGFAGLLFDDVYSANALRLDVSALGGDANLDGGVNLTDFNILAANFGQSDRNWLAADFTGDGIVNLADFNVLASNFGITAGPSGPGPEDWSLLAAVVPEPSLFCSVGVAVSAAMLRRRREAVTRGGLRRAQSSRASLCPGV